MITTTCEAALKEWQSVCDALGEGRQVVLLRKGGIADVGGRFEVGHRRFLLMPTWLHQTTEHLRPEWRHRLQHAAEDPAVAEMTLLAEVTDVRPVPSESAAHVVAARTVWSPAFVTMRWNYRPANPLWMLVLRVGRLASPVRVEMTAEMAGCRSWVPLGSGAELPATEPVLSDARFAEERAAVLSAW